MNFKIGQGRTFDDEGVMPAQILKNTYYMFYSGWNSRNTVPTITQQV